MNEVIAQNIDRASAVNEAIKRLVEARHRATESFVNFPIFHPSGAAATVRVSGDRDWFHLSDIGQAYREAEMVGGEGYFYRRAKIISQKFGIEIRGRELFVSVTAHDLAPAIIDLATASAEIANGIIEKIGTRHVDEIASRLLKRLGAVFGLEKLEPSARLLGASSRDWEVSALLHLKNNVVVFDAVTNHPQSIYATSVKFRDIALLSKPPKTVAVVHKIEELGTYYKILAQAGDVIEEDANDNTFLRAAA